MNIFLVNEDHPAATRLIDKLSGKKKDGEIIPLTSDEMSLYNSDSFQAISSSSEQQKIFQLNTDSHNAYVFYLDETEDNIDDALATIDRLSLNASIVRHR